MCQEHQKRARQKDFSDKEKQYNKRETMAGEAVFDKLLQKKKHEAHSISNFMSFQPQDCPKAQVKTR